MKRKIFIYTFIAFLGSSMFFSSCSLNEEIYDEYTSEVILADSNLLINMIAPPLGHLREFWQRESLWGQFEGSTDECAFPTRGTDWYDGGVWQECYFHQWTPQHRDVIACWNHLSSGIAKANLSLSVLGEGEDVPAKYFEYRGMLRFLRAYFMYNYIDLYGVVPYRDAFDADFTKDPSIFNREKGFNVCVNEAKWALQYMPEKGQTEYGIPTKDAARMLLAKLYLNKEAFKVGPPAYDSAMIYIDQIIDKGEYALAENYFGLFGPDNHENYLKADDEAILVAVMDDSEDFGLDDRVQWIRPAFHYNQLTHINYGGWNGCLAPDGYLEEVWVSGTDTALDSRWVDSTVYSALGIVNGFNYGQQFDVEGDSIFDRGGNPLNFTFEFDFLNADEVMGVRVLKYNPRDVPVNAARAPNDYLIWRYADALLMKAECLIRENNDAAGALTIVNQIRIKRNAPELESIELMDILDERGRELYWEGHRRQDMIRFGTYLLPKSNKDFTSPETAKLLPIPQTAIDAVESGDLKQNPGY